MAIFLCFVVCLILASNKIFPFPGGLGIEAEPSLTSENIKSITPTTINIETVEKDRQGKIVKTIKVMSHNEGKTFWDWLSLLGVPLSLAILGSWLQQKQQDRSKEEAQQQQEIAANETKEEALQVYFDRLSVFLVDKNLIAISAKGENKTDEETELLKSSVDFIRARTLSILRRFKDDPERKASVLSFLIDTNLIGRSDKNQYQLNLKGADFSGVNLYRFKQPGIDLSEIIFEETNFVEAELRGAILKGAFLEKARLERTVLEGADLEGADLKGAILTGAYLQGAILKGANLKGANLTDADLSGAVLTSADLTNADLSGANFEAIQWKEIDDYRETLLPNKEAFANVKNIPAELKKHLGFSNKL